MLRVKRMSLVLTVWLLWGAATPAHACIDWTPRADLLLARDSMAVAVVGSIIYAAGGNGLSALEAYDPATDTWTPKAPINDPTPADRWGAAAAAVNGKLYVIGGANATFSTLYPTVYEYDPSTDTWAVMASMSVGRAWLAVVTANDGAGDKIYAIGGYDAGTFVDTALVERFDPPPGGGPVGTWTTVAGLNVSRAELTAGVVNGKIYAVGGVEWAGGTLLGDVEMYDPTNDAAGWTSKAPLPIPREGVAATSVNGLLYVTGGDDDFTYTGEAFVHVYDPLANSWSGETPMSNARMYHGMVTVNQTLYVVGGLDGGGAKFKSVEEGTFTSVAVVKTQTPASPGIGEPVTYQIVVTNVGGAVIDSLTVVDTVAPEVTGVTTDQPAVMGLPTVTQQPGSGTRYVWSGSGLTMDPGESFTFTITGRVGLVCAPTMVSNTAYIIASNVSCSKDMFANAAGTMVQPPVMGITVLKTQTPPTSASASGGQPVMYEIVVTNTGTATIEDLLVVDTVSPYVTAVTTDQPAGFGSPAVTQVVGGTRYEWSGSGLDMKPGMSFTFTITGIVGVVSAATAVSNTASISAASACSVMTLLSNRTDFLAQVPAALEGSLVALVDPVLAGQDFLVTMTVTNTGEAGANGVTPDGLVASGTGGAILKDGPSPVPPVVLAGGGAITFTWTLTAASAGSVWFSNTVTGSDTNSGASVSTGVVVSNSITVIAPVLTAGLFVSGEPLAGMRQVSVGGTVWVTMTVTNTGTANADNVAPLSLGNLGCGSASLAGPTPASVATLVPGDAVTFTWTATADTAGTFAWRGRAWDQIPPPPPPGVVSNQANSPTVGTPAVLVSAASISQTPVSVGQWVTVSFTVTNTGGTPAVSVMPTLTSASTAGLTPKSGPVSAVTIPGCSGMHTFTWTYSTNGRGSLAFSLSVTGLDAYSLTEVFTSRTLSGLVQDPARLAASLSLSSTVVNAGGSFLLMITVTNTGDAVWGAAADGLLPPALDQYGLGSASVTAPLVAATTLVGSQSLTWTWTLTASSGGFVYFTATVTGADFNSGFALSTPVITSGPLQIDRPGIGIVDFTAGPTPVGLDELVTVTLFISNTGNFELQGAVPSVLSVTGDGQVKLESGPEPAAAAVPIGGTATFVWQYRTLRGGTVTFQGTVASAFGGVSNPAVSNAVTIQETRKNLDDLVVYPNPFNRELAVGRTVKFQRMPAFTVIKIYTIAGELVYELNAGANGLVEWDGRNRQGTAVTPGVYLYMAQSPDGSKKIGKLQVVK